ncbi:hypothetical protein ASPWEDRAFT_27560 [Aspergillus wentii DTO 134E9]|uniref:ATP-dependent RNA helicase n=1 Tax=Aspergillus wentii DTO 134E9 TaxID=1073089 RepID=A0A1L9RJ44_ASPWE|nr:uncharacterized protein ASPWEDRAFT_27560 [Aspergillus wentii DTO 134E9]KAI9932170.1 hypothetical protein MW887_009680 [Aspergillus wentii]OJJ34867.1 hypothetical protein ASPWEDRAFT_27560 [Aspergillus wentii DTO 134E9]
MLGTVRRYGVVQALRASAPRSLYARSIPQLSRWQAPSTSALPQIKRSLFHSSPFRSSAAAAQEVQIDDSAPASRELLTEFADLAKHGLIDPRVIRTITGPMKIKTMTDVQSQTIHETLQGDDVLAQAKTGTGKTLAFILPVLQNIMNDPSIQRGRSRRSTPADIRGIIISPTRELAEQIAVEAKKVAEGTGVIVQTAVGGTRKQEGLRRIQYQGCHLLIGTPGRLKDILSDPRSGVKAPKLSAFVLDEADRLLDDGFAPDIMELQEMLPDPMTVNRQTLMFSATVPREVMRMVRRTMKPNFKFVKTVKDDEVPTHQAVPQKVVRLNGYENALPALLELVKNYRAAAIDNPSQRPFKAIVYLNSTAQVTVNYQAFRNLMNNPGDRRSGHPLQGTRMYEIHSRLTQNQRTLNADYFRKASSGILFSSDVTARGMDFPDVTHVIQFGVPRDRPTYIHRLGRTARAKKTGEGWIFLHPGEFNQFNDKLGDLPVERDNSLSAAAVEISQGSVSPTDENCEQVKAAMEEIDEELKEGAHRAHIGTLVGVFRSKRDLIDALNKLAVDGYGCAEPPHLPSGMISNMGLNRTFSGNSRGGRFDDRSQRFTRNNRGRDFPRRSNSFNDRGRDQRRSRYRDDDSF